MMDRPPAAQSSRPPPRDQLPPLMGAALIRTLNRLRSTVLRSVYWLAAAIAVCSFAARRIFYVLVAPLLRELPGDNSALVFTGVHEAFFTFFKAAALAGTFLAMPFMLRELWRFLAPSFYRDERRTALLFVGLGTALFTAGAAFAYFAALPWGLRFFLSFADADIRPFLRVKEYFSLSVQLLIGFGLAFQIPLVTAALALTGIVTPAWLRAKRRYIILLLVVAAAVLTPPDVVSQLMLAGPMLALFEAGVYGAEWALRRRARAEGAADGPASAS